jgi:branched-chain amino acid transport system ATP-binding protein
MTVQTTEAVLEIEGLSVIRGSSTVVRDFSLSMRPGEVVGLLGANGAGKTTIVDAISGLAKKGSGTIRVNAQDITKLPAHKIAGLGVLQVSQDRELFGSLTVEENLVLGQQVLSKNRPGEDGRLEKVFTLFSRLRDRRAQRANSLSGGEQQMLAIGRALIGNPVLLVLDEPTSGLAPVLVKEVGHFLAEMRAAGMSILLVEQNVQVAIDLCDRFVVIRGGEKVFEGTRDDLGADPMKALGELYV